MKKDIRNVILFIIITILCGWIGIFIDNIIKQPNEKETLGMGFWLITPLLTVLILKLLTKNNRINLGLKPKIKKNFIYYIISFFIFPVVTFVILIIGQILGWINLTNFNFHNYFIVFVSTLIPNFIKNIFEELVWRGFLTQNLIKLNLSDKWIYLIVGGVWGIWHIPYYTHFLNENDLNLVLPVNKIYFVLMAIFTMICWTIMFVEIFRLTKSIWPVVFMHMIEDSTINHLILDNHIHITPGKEIFISPITGIFTTVIYISIGLYLRKTRMNFDKA